MKLVVKITPPWWTGPFMSACVLFARTFGVEPDAEKIACTVVRHSKVKVVYGD